MSGALNSVVGGLGGGQGGGLLSSIGGIVGGIFGGPIGAAIGGAIGNLIQDAVGEAGNKAVDTLQKENGMPPFLAKECKRVIDEAVGNCKNKNVDPESQHQVNNDRDLQSWKKDFVEELTQAMLKNVRAQLDGKDESGSGEPGAKKTSSKSWLQALAEGMGKTLGDKAAKMVSLSQKMSDLSSEGSKLRDAKGGSTGGTAGAQGGDEAKKTAAEKNAQEFTTAQTELQGVSQEFSLMQSAFSNCLKSIGEGLSQMGRKG